MSIGRRALHSTLFVAATAYLSEAVNFVVSVILARLLLPEYFGIVALAIFFNELFGRVREFGFDQALVHRQEDLEKARSAHFVLQVSASFLSFLLTLIFSPLLLRIYGWPVVKALLVISFFYIFKAASSTQRMVLEKELRFVTTTLVDLFALIFASLLAIYLAVNNGGLTSLVVYQVANVFMAFAVFWVLRPWTPIFVWDRKIITWYLRFGWYLWLGGLTTFVIYKFNDFVTGTFLSTTSLGFYSRAFSFAQRPTSAVTGVVSRVALPTYALLQKEKEKLSLTFNLVLRNIVRVSAPLSFFLFLLAPDFTAVLLGDKWLPMVPVFRLLLIYGFLRSVFDDAGAFLTAIGKPHLVSRYLVVQAFIILVTTPLLTYFWGVNGAAVSLNIVLGVGLLLAYRYVNRFVAVDFTGIFLSALPPALFTVILFAVFLARFWPELTLFSLSMEFLVVGLLYLFLLVLTEGRALRNDIKFLWGMMKK